MKKISPFLSGILGSILGVIIGFFLPIIICTVHDKIVQPEPGGGWITIGWLFWFISIPALAILGGISGVIITKRHNKKIVPPMFKAHSFNEFQDGIFKKGESFADEFTDKLDLKDTSSKKRNIDESMWSWLGL